MQKPKNDGNNAVTAPSVVKIVLSARITRRIESMNEYTIKKTAIADRWQRYKIQHGEHEEDAVGWLLESPNYIPIVFIFKESHSLNKEHLSLLIKKQFKESKGHFFLIAELVTRLIPKEVKA